MRSIAIASLATVSFIAICAPAMALSGTERQITSDENGHILTNLNVFSPDSEWIVYDERSDREGAKFDSSTIKRVNVRTKEVETLYEAKDDAKVGVVTYNPKKDSVVFIHGPEKPTAEWSYAGHHREGSIVSTSKPGMAVNLDARDVTEPYTAGALRGGSHVHIYAPDGEWLSFTYQDHVLNVLGNQGSHDRDQRNVGISVPVRAVAVSKDHERNRDGVTFTVLVTHTVNAPKPGSDEINRAYEEGWVGSEGYLKPDGVRQRRAIAFLGDTIDSQGQKLTEVFLADIPDDVTKASLDQPLEGTSTRLPSPPQGVVQRRLTFTSDRKFPGIQGPRFWVRASPDGKSMAFLMKDDSGRVQVYTVSPNGGDIKQITSNPFSVTSTFSWSPDGSLIAYAGDDSIFVTAPATGETTRVAPKDPTKPVLALAADFSHNGRMIAYQRVIGDIGHERNQIFVYRTIAVNCDYSRLGVVALAARQLETALNDAHRKIHRPWTSQSRTRLLAAM